MGEKYGSKTNSDFIFIAVVEMVRCTDAEFTAFQKKKSSKKREPRASKEAEATPKVEAISVVPISKVAAAGVPDAPFEVLGVPR